MQLEQIPVLVGVVVAILGLGVVLDAQLPEGSSHARERRRVGIGSALRRELDPTLHVPYRREVLVELHPVGAADGRLEPLGLVQDAVEDAAPVGVVALPGPSAEQPFEHELRIALLARGRGRLYWRGLRGRGDADAVSGDGHRSPP